MKHLHVSCALVESEGAVLAAQRSGEMNMPHKWEFPGGKIEPDETPEECLVRELVEEMGLDVAIRRALTPVTHRYETFIVTLYPFVCDIVGGEIVLHEHAAVRWLSPDEMFTIDWCAADIPIITEYLEQRARR